MNTCQFIFLSVIIAVSAVEERWTGPIADHRIGQLVQDTPDVAAAKRIHFEAYKQVRDLLPELPPEEQYPGDDQQPQIHHQQQLIYPHNPVTPPNYHVDGTHERWNGPFADHKLGQQVQETAEVAAARQHHLQAYSQFRSILPEIPQEEAPQYDYSRTERPAFPAAQFDYSRTERPAFPAAQFDYSRTQYADDVRGGDDVETARRAHLRAVAQATSLLQGLDRQTTTTYSPVVRPLAPAWNHFPADTPEVAAAKLAHARAVEALRF